MENQNKNLILARRAREENNAEDAKKYYDMVRTEDPDNAEAKFFYSYYRMMGGTKGEAYNNYISFCNGIKSTVSLIKASDDSEAEKKAFYKVIANCMENADKIVRAANKDIGGNNISGIYDAYKNTMGDLFSQIIAPDETDVELLTSLYTYKRCYVYNRHGIEWYKLGDEIESKHASIPELQLLAVMYWKEAIAHQQEYPQAEDSKKHPDFPEKYAEKIKKYEPTYEIPQKRGCITISK